MKSTLFNRWLPGVTLLAWSAVLLGYYFSGRVANLLYPSFRVYVLLAGVVMLVMSACFLALPGVAACCDDERCGHPLGRHKIGRILTFMILLLPITAAAMFSPNDFSATVAKNRGIAMEANGLVRRSTTLKVPPPAASDDPNEPPLPTKQGSQPAAQPSATPGTTALDDYLPKSKEGNIQVQVIDLLYAAQDTSMKADFTGKTVETIGQLMPDDSNNPSGNRFKLMRMFMWCCAADARPIAALVDPGQKTNVPEMTWVKVVGKVEFPVENGKTVPVLRATSVKQVDPPEETMLY